jgi:hypothetical protein
MKKFINILILSFILMTTFSFLSITGHLSLADNADNSKGQSDISNNKVSHSHSGGQHHHDNKNVKEIAPDSNGGSSNSGGHRKHPTTNVQEIAPDSNGGSSNSGGHQFHHVQEIAPDSNGGSSNPENQGSSYNRDNNQGKHANDARHFTNPSNDDANLYTPCINVSLPVQLGDGNVNCLHLNEETNILNSINPVVTLKPFSGGYCSFADYTVKDVDGSKYCLESNK